MFFLESKKDLQNIPNFNMLNHILHVFQFGSMMAELALNHTNVQKLLESDAKFDLIINEAHVGFAHHFKAPIIAVSPVGSNSWVNVYTGNPAPSSYIPDPFLGLSGKMTFLQRLENSLVSTDSLLSTIQNYYAQHNK